MSEFLKFATRYSRGWKRKTGLMVLGIACILTGWWIKSLYWMQNFPIARSEYGFMQLVPVDGKLESDSVTPKPAGLSSNVNGVG